MIDFNLLLLFLQIKHLAVLFPAGKLSLEVVGKEFQFCNRLEFLESLVQGDLSQVLSEEFEQTYPELALFWIRVGVNVIERVLALLFLGENFYPKLNCSDRTFFIEVCQNPGFDWLC